MAYPQITQRRSARPSTVLSSRSPWIGTGGRHQSEKVVAMHRIHWSPWTGARRLQALLQ